MQILVSVNRAVNRISNGGTETESKSQNFFDSVNQTEFSRKIKLVNRLFGSVFLFFGSVFQFQFFVLTPGKDDISKMVSLPNAIGPYSYYDSYFWLDLLRYMRLEL